MKRKFENACRADKPVQAAKSPATALAHRQPNAAETL